MTHVRWAVVILGLVVTGCAAPSNGTAAPDRARLAGSERHGTAAPDPGDVQIDPEPPPGQSPAPTPVGGQPWDAGVTSVCAQALTNEGITGLDQVAQTADGHGVTSFWAAGKRSVVCDALTGVDAPPPVLLRSAPGSQRGFDDATLGLASTVVTGPDGEVSAIRYVAGGRLPWPVQEIGYTFPDRHTERARFVRSGNRSADTWWSVTYTAEDGLLVAPDTDPADLEPLVVAVTGGAAEAFRLPWDEALATAGQRSE